MRLAILLLAAIPAFASLTGDVKRTALSGNFPAAEAALAAYKAANGETSEYIQAYSWLARGALAGNHAEAAEKYAAETRRMVAQKLQTRKLDADPFLPIALGAAIEVEAQLIDQGQGRPQAVAYLRTQLARYHDTSINARIQKNINQLTIVGKPAPPLVEQQWLGPKPPPLAALRGKPVLLYFWAHWCGDCRHEIPILVRLKQEFGPKGLVLLGPTQFYGYAQNGADAPPEVERQWIETVRTSVYAPLADVPAPLSQENFKTYGASTTPTIVLIGRDGRVVLYHPGNLEYTELAGAVTNALTAQPANRPPAASHAPGPKTPAAGSHTSARRPSIP